jgi:hypothetical protein
MAPRKTRAGAKAGAASDAPSTPPDKKRAASKRKAKDDAPAAPASKHRKARSKSVVDDSDADDEPAGSDAGDDDTQRPPSPTRTPKPDPKPAVAAATAQQPETPSRAPVAPAQPATTPFRAVPLSAATPDTNPGTPASQASTRDASVSAFQKDYGATANRLPYFVDDGQLATMHKDPDRISSGKEWEALMAAGRAKGSGHPVGAYSLEYKKMRNSEAQLMAYMRFPNVQTFRQWMLVKGKFSPVGNKGGSAGPDLGLGPDLRAPLWCLVLLLFLRMADALLQHCRLFGSFWCSKRYALASRRRRRCPNSSRRSRTLPRRRTRLGATFSSTTRRRF